MALKEFNNRKTADKFAEYITGKELRQYLADKVKKYCGDDITVFDGAIGSGQLEEFIKPKFLYGVEIQEEAVKTCRENYPNSEIHHMSFFNYFSDVKADATIMNYPFSLKFKDLPDEDKENIQKLYPWKKSGLVDDMFILKGLDFTKRYGFYICFPGIGYRKPEKTFREIVGNRLKEFNVIHNAFEDTGIAIVFLVIDKEKVTEEVYKEIYDCRSKKIEASEVCENAEERWRQLQIYVEPEKIDIDVLEKDLKATRRRINELSEEIDRIVDEIR